MSNMSNSGPFNPTRAPMQANSYGELLKRWRRRAGINQLDKALLQEMYIETAYPVEVG